MHGDDKTLPGGKKPKAALTSDALSDMVLDHMLANPDLFVAGPGQDDRTTAERFTALLDSINALAHRVAKTAIVNRTSLSALPVFANEITPDPEDDSSDNVYELRYRIIEQYGDNPPVKDDLYSFDEAVDIYGVDFVKRYWGELGENCPSLVSSSSNRQLWFSVVRYPVSDLSAREEAVTKPNAATEDDVLSQITRSPGFK